MKSFISFMKFVNNKGSLGSANKIYLRCAPCGIIGDQRKNVRLTPLDHAPTAPRIASPTPATPAAWPSAPTSSSPSPAGPNSPRLRINRSSTSDTSGHVRGLPAPPLPGAGQQVRLAGRDGVLPHRLQPGEDQGHVRLAGRDGVLPRQGDPDRGRGLRAADDQRLSGIKTSGSTEGQRG